MSAFAASAQILPACAHLVQADEHDVEYPNVGYSSVVGENHQMSEQLRRFFTLIERTKMKLHTPELAGNALLSTVTTISCLGFLLIGFDNGLMGGFVNSTAFTTSLGLDEATSTGTNLEALIVAIFEVGAFGGCIITSIFGQDLGRRKSILIGVIIMIIGKPSAT